jgi:hypothetical protein
MPHVYFIVADGDDGYYKIGSSDDVNKRLSQLQCGNRRKLSVYKLIECDDHFATERLIHHHFRDHRVMGEWFHLCDEDIESIVINNLQQPENTTQIKTRAPRTRRSWDNMFEILSKYVSEFNQLPPMSCLYDNIRLGSWCNIQCMEYRKGLLHQDRIVKLTSIPIWKWSRALSLDDKIAMLEEFMEVNGRAPKIYESYQNIHVGKLTSTMRMKHKRGVLSENTTQLLEKIPNWCWIDDPWTIHYNELVDFLEKYNRYPLKEDDIRLSEWVSSNKRKDKLTEERIKMMESLPNWVWSVYKNVDWVRELRDFYDKFGRLPYTGEKHNDVELAHWVSGQKTKIRGGIDRYNLLEQYPHLLKSSWDESYEIVYEWMVENKKIPSAFVDYKGIKIGIWVRNQRRDKINGTISEEHIAAMEEIPGWVW